MKSLLVTLLILAGAFLAYDYYLAPPLERIVFSKPEIGKPALPAPSNTTPTSREPVESQPEQSRAATKPPTPAQSKPAESLVPKPAEPPTEPVVAFHPPRFDPIEVLTQNWQRIPKSAFPRAVKLAKDTTFTLSFGASMLRAGADVVALGMDNGMLIVAPNDMSPARKPIAVDDTDLKMRLVVVYEQWKRDRTEEARKQFEDFQRQPKPPVSIPVVDETGKPTMAADGTFPLLIARLKTGQPSEITPSNILKWGKPEPETVKGIPTWTVEVKFKTKTMFGDMDVDTLVHVQNGKVRDWIYKGSGEPVP